MRRRLSTPSIFNSNLRRRRSNGKMRSETRMVSIAQRRCTEGTHQLQYVAADIHALMHSLHGRDATCATKLAPTLLAEVTSTEPVCYFVTHSMIVHRQLPLSQVIDCGRVAPVSPFAHSGTVLSDTHLLSTRKIDFLQSTQRL